MATADSEALSIAREVRHKLLIEPIHVSSALRACLTISSLLKEKSDYEWIDLELNGYSTKFKTVGEMEKVLPEYRNAHCLYFDEFNRPITIAEKWSILEEYPLGQSVAELEECAENGLHIYSGPGIAFLMQQRVPVHKALVSSVAVRRVLNAVSNRALEFLNKTILELQYARIHSGIFEEARASVDKQLLAYSRPALEKLVGSYEKLSSIGTPLECSQTAFACRQVLQDFTDAIFKPEYLEKEEKVPRHEQTKNKLLYSLRQKLEGKKNRELELLSAQMSYLNAYFDKLTSYVQKQTHPAGFEPTPEDAKRCVVYTYLIIGDILSFLKSERVETA
jgi:hypothetical protein